MAKQVTGKDKPLLTDENYGSVGMDKLENAVESKSKVDIKGSQSIDIQSTTLQENDNTYLSINKESENVFLEFDLVFLREKGVLTKELYFSMKPTAVIDQENHIYSLSIKNKEDFLKIKEFFCNLDWDKNF